MRANDRARVAVADGFDKAKECAHHDQQGNPNESNAKNLKGSIRGRKGSGVEKKHLAEDEKRTECDNDKQPEDDTTAGVWLVDSGGGTEAGTVD
jgi:hypothetical protein